MPTLRSALRAASPTIVTGWLEYAQRFGRLGLPRAWAFENRRKHDLALSKVELLPESVRHTPGVVLDIGANHGQWSAALLRTLPRVERLIAFEPNPTAAADATARLGAFPKATVHAVALGAEDGTAPLRCEGSDDMASLLSMRDDVKATYRVRGAARWVEVPVRRLDDFTRGIPRIGLVKLDVQGFEAHVVAGGRETLARTAAVLVEVQYVSHYAGDLTFDGIHALMKGCGFRLHAVSAPWMSDAGQPMWADAVYAR